MAKSLLRQLSTREKFKQINTLLLDETTKSVVKHLRETTEFEVTLESTARIIDRNLLINGSATTSTGTERLVLIRQFHSTKPATYHVYRDEKKDEILTKKVAEVVKKEREKIGAR